ncbi:MAG: hypothetical protein V3V16_14905 [Melioribacteraceae bacterium]
MGQQQLLLIVLGLILVGISVVVGINVFTANSIEKKRDMLISQCLTLGAMAQKYYRVPSALAGGGQTFTNWDVPITLKDTELGSFTAVSTAENVIITAIGNEVISTGDSIEVQIKIFHGSTQILLTK